MSGAVIAGISVPGIERGWQMTVDRHIEVVDVVGSRPQLVPLFASAAADEAALSCELWVNGSTAATLESTLPPKGSGASFTLALPGTASIPALPGFGTYSADTWRLFGCVPTAPATSLGRKAPVVDLFGYALDLRFGAGAYGTGGAGGNERTGSIPTDATIPAILSRKFSAHQIQDSSSARSPLPIGSGVSFPTTVHGRRRDARIQLDHMTESEATAVCNWFRAIRASRFNIAHAALFGPGMAGTVSAVALELSFMRPGGNWWDADLLMSYAGAAT